MGSDGTARHESIYIERASPHNLTLNFYYYFRLFHIDNELINILYILWGTLLQQWQILTEI